VQPTTTALLDRLAAALGGKAELEAAATESITATGWRCHPGWGTDPGKPELVAEFAYTAVKDLVRPRYRLTMNAQTHLVPTELRYTEISSGPTGHLDGVDFMFDPRPVRTPIPSWRVATRQRHLDLTSPLRLARKLLAPSANVTAGEDTSDGRRYPVLTLRELGRPPARIHLDPGSGLPVKVETKEEHSPLGDALVEVRFDGYRRVGALKLPHLVTILVNGLEVHEEIRSRIEIGATASDADFAVPDPTITDGGAEQVAFAQHSTEWIMSYVYAGVRFYFDLQTAPVSPAAVELAEGVKIVLGPSHNTLVVEMPDHVLAVEAPMYDEYARAALAQVKAAFPDKPLRTVVATHFHYDHVGGIREFVADGGVTVLAGRPTVPFFEEVFRHPHTVDPDRFESNPVPVVVQGVDDSVRLPTADGGYLEVHRVPSDHSDDMLIVYLSESKIVFESDLWNPTPVMPAPNSGRGRLTAQLYQSIVDLGLDVRTIVGGHSGGAHAAPLAYLKTAAGR
jgi:glyoxylase-like metal-dependent hydrolase (beta-lactamase superfamily II)